MSAQCSHCGTNAPEGAKICFMCGGRVVGSGAGSTASPLSTAKTQYAHAKTEIGVPLHVGERLPSGATAASPIGRTVPGDTPAVAAGPPGGFGPPPGPSPAPAPTPPGGYPPGAHAGPMPAAGPPPQVQGGMMAPPHHPGAPGYGPTPIGGPAPLAGFSPAPPKDDSTLKIGCGIAGCAGVLLVMLVVGGALYFMLSAPGPVASGPSSGGPSPGGDSSGPSAAPSSGSLRGLVKEQVGPYRLVASSPNVADGPFRAGAVDSLGLSYKSSAGIEVKHFLVVYGTEAEAAAKPRAMIELVRKDVPVGQTFTVRNQPYKNRDGEVIGKVYHVETDPEVVMWHNGKLFAVANAPSDHARQFFKAVPY